LFELINGCAAGYQALGIFTKFSHLVLWTRILRRMVDRSSRDQMGDSQRALWIYRCRALNASKDDYGYRGRREMIRYLVFQGAMLLQWGYMIYNNASTSHGTMLSSPSYHLMSFSQYLTFLPSPCFHASTLPYLSRFHIVQFPRNSIRLLLPCPSIPSTFPSNPP
jgi:hypothetical protein